MYKSPLKDIFHKTQDNSGVFVMTEINIYLANAFGFYQVVSESVRYPHCHGFKQKFLKMFLMLSNSKATHVLTLSCFCMKLCVSLTPSLSVCLSSNSCFFFFKLSPLLRAGKLGGWQVGKDPVNSLSVEGFIQKTLVTSPEVALFSQFPYYQKFIPVWVGVIQLLPCYLLSIICLSIPGFTKTSLNSSYTFPTLFEMETTV